MAKERIFNEGCQGRASAGGSCSDRNVRMYEKVGESFGVPFTTRANLCYGHASKLGFSKIADQAVA